MQWLLGRVLETGSCCTWLAPSFVSDTVCLVLFLDWDKGTFSDLQYIQERIGHAVGKD